MLQMDELDEKLAYMSNVIEFEQWAADQMRSIMRQRKARTPREAAKDEGG